MMKSMTKYTFTFLLFLFLQNTLTAQKLINWSYLADVKYEVKYSEELGYNLHIATFGKSIKNLRTNSSTKEDLPAPLAPIIP